MRGMLKAGAAVPEEVWVYDHHHENVQALSLIHIFLADEEDLFALRTNDRKEDMYLYRINIDRENLKKAFLGFAEKINSLHERPRYYHTVTANCTTELVDTFKNYLPLKVL